VIKLKLEITQSEAHQSETRPSIAQQTEKDFLKILSELIDDRIWLDVVLNRNKLSQSEFDKTSLGNNTLAEPQEVANRLIQNANKVKNTETDLEKTIKVPAGLSIQGFPYQK